MREVCTRRVKNRRAFGATGEDQAVVTTDHLQTGPLESFYTM